jgi:selenocysteine lyase/cysteine desulfurase
VQKSVRDWEELSADPSVNYYGGVSAVKRDLAIEKTAAYMNCPLNQTFLTSSTTDGINLVMEGLLNSGALSRGDHVLTSNFEHPGGLAAMLHYESLGLVTVDYVSLPLQPESEQEVLNLIEAAVTPRTTVFMLSHITQMSGLLFPVQKITNLLHKYGIYVIIDGAHSFGMHVDVPALEADAFITSAHKWLLAPSGTGVLCFNSGLGSVVSPVRFSSGIAGINHFLARAVYPQFRSLSRLSLVFLSLSLSLSPPPPPPPPLPPPLRPPTTFSLECDIFERWGWKVL